MDLDLELRSFCKDSVSNCSSFRCRSKTFSFATSSSNFLIRSFFWRRLYNPCFIRACQNHAIGILRLDLCTQDKPQGSNDLAYVLQSGMLLDIQISRP